MRTNYQEWKEAFFEELCYQFDKFNIYLAENNEEDTDFETFCIFVYKNTRKSRHSYLDKLIAPF